MWVIAKPFKIRKQYTGHDRGAPPPPRPNLTKDPLTAVSIWKSYIWTSDKDPKSERPDSRGKGLKREKLAVIASGAKAYPNSLHQKCLWILSPPPRSAYRSWGFAHRKRVFRVVPKEYLFHERGICELSGENKKSWVAKEGKKSATGVNKRIWFGNFLTEKQEKVIKFKAKRFARFYPSSLPLRCLWDTVPYYCGESLFDGDSWQIFLSFQE